MLFGVAAVACFGAILTRRRWNWAITLLLCLLLGAACGTAASGKYAGAVTLGPALILVLLKTWRRWWIALLMPLLLLAGAGGAWAGINYRAVQDWEGFRGGFDEELHHSVTEHGGVSMHKPNAFFIEEVIADAMPHVTLLAALLPIAILLQRRALPTSGLFVALLGATYLVMLSCSVIPFFRYVLPATVCLYIVAGMSAAWFVRAAEWRPIARVALLLLVGGGMAYTQGRRIEDYELSSPMIRAMRCAPGSERRCRPTPALPPMATANSRADRPGPVTKRRRAFSRATAMAAWQREWDRSGGSAD